METYFYHSLTPLQWFFILGLGLSFLTDLFYSFFYIRKLKTNSQPSTYSSSTPVSIIICAKNQAHYLEKNLPGFLKQDHPNYEIIVVDNGSVDDTENVLIRLKNTHPQLRSTKIPIDDKFKHNKKLAITIGVKAAKHDRIIHLNPNSYTDQSNWLQNTLAHADGKLYNAYSNFGQGKGFFYNFYRYDMLKHMVKLAAFTNSNKLYAGNAYNMSFSKSDFLKNKGYAGNAHFEAGYDHILSMDLSKTTDSIFSTKPETRLNISSTNHAQVWKTIKKHYYTCRKYIPFKRKLLLDLEVIAQFLFLLFLLLSILNTQLYFSLLAIYLIKIALKGYSFKNSVRHLREENLFLSSYVYVFIRPLYNLLFYIHSHLYSKRS